MNRLFVVNKPIFRTSNSYMGYIKRKYNTKKVGFSGTLDPFATGCLIVATGQYTRLFQYLNKTPKAYAATLWLGANSESLDIENVDSIKKVKAFEIDIIEQILDSLKGELTYYPPKYSAKKVGGKRAYVDGTLSSLKRLYEGKFHYDNEKALNPLAYLKIPQNYYSGNIEYMRLGKKLTVEYFSIQADGEYWIDAGDFFAVIEIINGNVSYKLNRMEKL
ncbi:MAG: tRNA pseudouridine(55) synthase TruB [Campylobacterales bacterium]|nr:tRNA pseudouridine(55) synthase TruB [Campylobacterales bacterium]